MKKVMIAAMMFIGLAFVKSAAAQVKVNVNVNIGSQPVWGPVGYDYAEYYYFPDIEAYYDVPTRQYIYLDGSRWVKVRTLPARYRGFDVYNSYKVVINERDPYLRHNTYKVKYVGYKGKHGQQIIRDSHDEKYYVVKGHPEHAKYKGEKKQKGNNGKGRGNGKH